jgi:hypothetical protein
MPFRSHYDAVQVRRTGSVIFTGARGPDSGLPSYEARKPNMFAHFLAVTKRPLISCKCPRAIADYSLRLSPCSNKV